MFVETVVLACIDRFQGERTVNAIYYLLAGKMSAQTIQDVAWFELHPYFNLFPDLRKSEFAETLLFLHKQKWITMDRQIAWLTDQGEKIYREEVQRYPLPANFNGYQFHKIDEKFWSRLSLIVQIFSHWAHDETGFISVERDPETQRMVKKWLFVLGKTRSRHELITDCYEELSRLLQMVNHKGLNPNLLVYRLSGYRKSGLTFRQLADRLHIDETYIRVLFRSVLHGMILLIRKYPKQFPLFSSFVRDLQQPFKLTRSTARTYDLLKAGKSVTEIARLRQLKPSTIQDHVVEIALMDPDFSIDPFVSPPLQEKIRIALQNTRSRKLRQIKEYVPEADYFSIRLVLASRFKPSEKNK